jgi:enoyl-CoA hydratase/carnithine racemase
MADCLVVSEPDEGIVRLVLNRPAKKNALSIELRDAMSDALEALADNESVRVVVVAASGDTFCAGFDLGEFNIDEPAFQKQLWRSSDRFHQQVLRFPLPTIASVQGPALAGGFDLAVLCDLRIADTTARFAHPEQSWSDVVFSPLADLLGSARARDLCFTGRSIDAGTALSIGLVSAVVEPDDLAHETLRTAAMIARAPRGSLLRGKAKAINRSRIPQAASTLEL